MAGPARTKPCDAGTSLGRRRKAAQFYQAAHVVSILADEASEVADSYVTLLVHAGIAASDVLCCAALGEHSRGQNHAEAIALLAKVSPDRSHDLGTLLNLKTKAGYSHQPMSKGDRAKAERSAERLMAALDALPTT
ncbi:MAG: hypothetical protein JWP74_765 [Marmoricola sp.]|nr:hypothetical protein [Marmoricola sp.]